MYHHEEESKKKPLKLKGKILRAALVVLLIGAAASILLYRDSINARLTKVLAADTEDPVPVRQLERTPYQLEVRARGEIVGLESLPLATPSTRGGGLKIGWLIPEGSFVNAGDAVVRYDATEANLNLERSENTLVANQERTKITSAQQDTNETVLALDRTDAEKEYEYSITVMPQDETIFSKWDIIEAKINAGLAKERIGFLANKGRVQKRIARSDQQILAIERNKAQSDIDIAKQTLSSLELRSPTGGLVVYRRDRSREPQVGDESYAGQVLVEVVDLAALQARIYVLERDAGSLARDKEVLIRLDSIPEKQFHGTIRSLTALAQTIERGSPLKYFTCEVTVRDAAQDLKRIKPGMSLDADVILEQYDSCFVVPASAVVLKGTDIIVYVQKGEKWEAKRVDLGASAHGQATILGGITEQDLVAMRDPYESRKVRLPDFSKASAQDRGRGGPGGPGGRMIMEMVGGGGGGGMGGGSGRGR